MRASAVAAKALLTTIIKEEEDLEHQEFEKAAADGDEEEWQPVPPFLALQEFTDRPSEKWGRENCFGLVEFVERR
jgi:hypothetical protein